MPALIYSGAEVPSNRKILEGMGVSHFGFSYDGARKRGFPKTKRYLLQDHFQADAKVFVTPGVQPQAAGSVAELTEFAADYQDFIMSNLEFITGFTEFDSWVLGLPWVEQQRTFWIDSSDEKVWPVWHDRYGFDALTSLAQRFENVALPYGTIEAVTTLAGRTRALGQQYGVTWHALACAKPDNLRSIQFETASTMSWLSPMRRGETILWDGNRIQRYPQKMKDQARLRSQRIARDAGLDVDLVKADDNKEVARLAIWSYQQLEKSMDKRPPFTVIQGGEEKDPLLVDKSADVDDPGEAERGPHYVDNSLESLRHDLGLDLPQRAAPVTPRNPHEMINLPVMGFTMQEVVEKNDEGHDVIKEIPVARSTGVSLRQCDTCFVASNCPAFKAASTCTFNLPVEIRTKDQFKALLTTIIEMQAGRVAFAKFTEDLNGGYPDPNVSSEIDRLFRLSKTLKEMDENRDFIRITAERQSSGGVLSAIFGDRASALKEIEGGAISEGDVSNIIKGALE
jgi:hypothetical protein